MSGYEQGSLFDDEPAKPSAKGRLFAVDGYGIIYRSYFAFINRPLTDAQGRNVSAVFGFFNTLMMIIGKYNPEYLVVAMDAHGKTFRHELYPEYKANRDAAPEDLHAQVPMILDILKAAGIPYRMQVGMEADDIIATLCRQAGRSGLETVIVTGDKDLMQLVGDGVTVLRPPRKGEKDYMLCTKDEVPQIYGVKPDQIVDYLTILGDSSDNVPGIDGLGPKGAEKLLGQYGTLGSVYSHIDELSPSVQAKLEAAKDHIGLSHTLIVLKDDLFKVDDFDKEGFSAKDLDWSKAVPLFYQAGSKTLAALAARISGKSVSHEAPPPEANPEPAAMQDDGFRVTMSPNPDYKAITTLEELDRTLKEAASLGIMALDTETTSVDEMQASLVGFSFCSQIGKSYYVPLVCEGRRMLDEKKVLEILSRRLEGVKVVGQNIKYDYNVLRRAGLVLGCLHFDTMIAAWLLSSDSGVYNMDDLAKRNLAYDTVKFEDVVPKGKLFSDISLSDSVRYGAEDSDVTWALYQLFGHRLEKAGLMNVFTEIEMPLVKTIADMEYNGILLDTDKIAALSKTLEDERIGIEAQVYKACGKEFNLNSPKQLQEVLFVDRNLPTGKKTRSGFSTDSDVLEDLANKTDDPVPSLILRSRFLTKLRGYCEGLPALVNPSTGRIHPSFLQTGTRTGRLSCKNPNLQNIPVRTEEGRMIRGAFPSAPGCVLLSADYSQIELVVLAHYSNDPALLDAFRSGEDVHRRTASMIFGQLPELVTPDQRRIAKTINFGVIYGMSAFRLSNELGISRKEAQGFIDSYFLMYKGVKKFVEQTQQQAKKDLMIHTMFGHQRLIPQMASSNKVELAGAERIAVNSVIQGTAAEIMKKAMIGVSQTLIDGKFSSKLLLQVHDELIFEVPEAEVESMKAMVSRVMTSAAKLSVPLRCSIETGTDWGQMH
ncbi:MAG: DNA polymerase I [Sphaerochaetaceae bacterium]